MPVYLLHGFRWPRALIRIHIILQNLDDAAAEWLIAPATTATLLENFKEIFPDQVRDLPGLRFIEQYDPADTSSASASQPYAYVADMVHVVQLGVDVDEIRGRGVSNDQWASLLELRDRLSPDAKVGWYVVVCGDEERYAPESNDEISIGTRGHTPTRSISMPKSHHTPTPTRTRMPDTNDTAVHTRRPDGTLEHDQEPLSSPASSQKGLRRLVVKMKSYSSIRQVSHSLFEQPPPMPSREI